ncbi:MAG: alkaline phosphatase family protein [Humidesulfovibrio sp.]|nr:phosphodiesterase [Desulfovibrio sp.]MDO9082292.1 alkaline phosphatase family protein [Humidesulfovibrio sp.]
MSRPRLVVLGLDGLPLKLARSLTEECGPRLPNLARLTAQARSIEAELPELSPVNWTSFFTAQGPGAHGVYGFTVLDPASYALRIVSFRDVRGPTIFQRLGERGLVSRVLNLPNMAPAAPLRGMLVAGFVADGLESAVYPPFLLGPLKAAGYRVEPDTTRGAAEPEYLLGQLRQSLAARRAALDLLWPDLAWDLFVCVLTETDRLFHFLFPAVERPEHPLHAACLAFLAEWDALLGEVLARYDALPGPKRLLVLADHGFCALEQEVDLNRVLVEAGHLRLGRPARDEWDAAVITDDSRAFALDPGRIYLHRQGLHRRGRVAETEAPALTRDLRALLLGLTFQGRRVMNRVLDGPELYQGRAAEDAPDLVCVPEPGFDLKAKFDRAHVFGLHGRFGMHRPEDAFFYDTGGSSPVRVRDVGQLVLEYFGRGISAETPPPGGITT